VNVIGLDLSLTAPGMAAPGQRPETVRTDAKRGDKRFCDIRDWLIYNIEPRRWGERRVDLAMIEAVPPYDHASSGLERVHGVAREVLARYDIPFAYVNVTALKAFATGNGRADKAEVMAWIEKMYGWAPEDDNQADAWVLRKMGEVLPADPFFHSPSQLQALSSIAWPLRPGDPHWPQPYGTLTRKPVTKKCRHGVICLKNGDGWLHPFNVVTCDKPPK
jgi:Holliday junction resolvasome RuvABC endonuclease subunit